MNLKKLSIIRLTTGLLIAMVLFTTSCKKLADPTEGVKLIINFDPIKTTFSIQFIDAKTGELIGWEDNKIVQVTISGPNADDVIDNIGLQKSSYSSVKGFLSLALDPDVVPTKENPVTFSVVAHLNGYISTSKNITIINEGKFMYEIQMADFNNLPNGVTKIVDNSGTTDTEGKVTGNINISTPGGEARLFIPAGTILKTAEEEPLVGQLEITLIHFSNMEDESLLSFPGGLSAYATMPDGSEQNVFFFSAGFVSLDIFDGDGDEAAIVEVNPLELTAVVPEETYNSDSQTGIADGDTIPLWSYNEGTGEWAYETVDTIVLTNKGTYEVTSELWHLTWWNWDWWWWEWWCYEGLHIYFESEEYYCDCYWWTTDVRNPYNNTLLMRSWFHACHGEPVIFWNAPAYFPVNTYYSSQCYGVYTETDVYYYENLCAPDELYVYFYAESMGTTVDVEITGFCASHPEIIIRPTLSYWVRKWNDWCFRWFEVINGYGEICGVELGETYIIGVYANGEWHEHEFLIEYSTYVQYDIEFPTEICSEIFGL